MQWHHPDPIRAAWLAGFIGENSRFDQVDLTALRAGPEQWNQRREERLRVSTPFRPALDQADLAGVDLDFHNLQQAYLRGANLADTRFDAADLAGAQLQGASAPGAVLDSADLSNGNLTYAEFCRATLRHAQLTHATLDKVDLRGADLTGADLTGARFPGMILGGTTLDHIRFGTEHLPMHDGSDSLVIRGRDALLNWEMIRRVSALPLFELSYVGLSGSILMITTIGYVNHTGVIESLDYPVPLPGRMMWLLLASFLLFLGTTMYRLKCPGRVQEFSETQWVEQHARPRLQYLSESLRRPWQLPTAILIFFGGLLGAGLLMDRVWAAAWYVVEELIRVGTL